LAESGFIEPEIAVCLVTGEVMLAGPDSAPTVGKRRPGQCSRHAMRVGSGVGIYFLISKCTPLLVHNHKSAYFPSLYVDEHGEEDRDLRRGRPLYLNKMRYERLAALWRNQEVPREVAQLRGTSERVIRDNWY